jgi:hypothetical protein
MLSFTAHEEVPSDPTTGATERYSCARAAQGERHVFISSCARSVTVSPDHLVTPRAPPTPRALTLRWLHWAQSMGFKRLLLLLSRDELSFFEGMCQVSSPTSRPFQTSRTALLFSSCVALIERDRSTRWRLRQHNICLQQVRRHTGTCTLSLQLTC